MLRRFADLQTAYLKSKDSKCAFMCLEPQLYQLCSRVCTIAGPVPAQFQYNRPYLKLPLSISQYRNQIPISIL